MKHKCVYCGGTVTDGTTTDHYNWGGKYLVIIENVPCGICDKCGEKYFDNKVVRRIEILAHPLIKEAKRPSKKPIAVVNYVDGRVLESALTAKK
jgi:YgiT-type zinc finger domain-containing protein